MGYILDIVIVGLFIGLVSLAYKKGFLSTVIDTFAVVISAVVSYKVYEQVAEKAYDLFVRNLVETRFTRVLDEISGGLSVGDKVSAMIDGLPQGAVKLAEVFGVTKGSLVSSMVSAGDLSDKELISLAVEKIGHTIMINVTEFVTFALLFVVITLALRVFANILKKANDIPLLGKFNALLGAVIGIVKAAAIVLVACVALYFIAGMSGAEPVIEAINSSFIYNFIFENIPVFSLVG
jgi:uncharacterized membrane protein required for colicin V production